MKQLLTILSLSTLAACSPRAEHMEANNKVLCDMEEHKAYHVSLVSGTTKSFRGHGGEQMYVVRTPNMDKACQKS